MNPKEYTIQMKNIYEVLYDIILDDNANETNFQQLRGLIISDDEKENRNKIKMIFSIISKISKNHHRKQCFNRNIDCVLLSMKDDIKKYISNYEIFDIFKNNKRILLFLIQEQMLIIDKSIANKMINAKYSQYNYPIYFYHEIKQFINKKVQNQIDHDNEQILVEAEKNFELFDQKRKIGENDKYIYQLIQNDSVVDFISYINKTSFSLSSKVEPSIFETNTLILKKQPSLIEYSAFYGSIQIFKYLYNSEIDLKPSLWIYAIHGKNPDIIHFLEENHIDPPDKTFRDCLNESIKCHHADIMNYFLDMYFPNNTKDIEKISKKVQYYLLSEFPDDLRSYLLLYFLCKYNYLSLVEQIAKDPYLNINQEIPIKPEFRKNYLLNIAIERENIELIRILLNVPQINVNVRSQERINRNNHDEKGHNKTALFIAIEKGNFEIVKLLLEHKDLDINAESHLFYNTYRNYDINTNNLIFAIEKRNTEIVKLLLNHPNININLASITNIYEDNDRSDMRIIKPPLIAAIENEQVEIVDLLLKNNNINVNQKYLYSKKYDDYQTGYTIHKSIISMKFQNLFF